MYKPFETLRYSKTVKLYNLMTLLCMLLEILIRYDTEDSKETIRQSMDVY